MAGIALFLVVSCLWTLWWAFELDYGEHHAIPPLASPGDVGGLIAAVPSALSVVSTGYLLGRIAAAAWLGWIPGALMVAVGYLLSDDIDDNIGWLIFVGGLVLMFGWPFYFLPLIAFGVFVRNRRAKKLTAGPSALDSA